ncbi:MAG: ABC transporter ATP-binding protein [Acidimicrobiia bacterium]|nr:ABC transporter ATP-binding protein [Acidimicrobiia bacterium]
MKSPSSATPREGPLLEVEDFYVRFDTDRGRVHAVNGVSLSLDQGETLGIVGESGSGKTVLSRAVMGLVGDGGRNHVTGTVRFDGREISSLSPRDLRKYWGTEMAMVFQDPMTSLNPVKRVGAQFTEALRYHLDLSRREATERAVDLLRSVGIPEPQRAVGRYPHEFSGGMRQRVTIGIALACNPRLLFGDEPTTALDVTVQAQILDLLKVQQVERDMALILVTHDLAVVRGRSDRIAVMYAGKVVETAPTATLFAHTRMPYTEALINALPRLTGPTHVRLRAIPGRPPDMMNPPDGCPFSPRCPYAQERCLVEVPPLMPSEDPEHQFACWYPVGTPEWTEARDRNTHRGETAAGTQIVKEMV